MSLNNAGGANVRFAGCSILRLAPRGPNLDLVGMCLHHGASATKRKVLSGENMFGRDKFVAGPADRHRCC